MVLQCSYPYKVGLQSRGCRKLKRLPKNLCSLITLIILSTYACALSQRYSASVQECYESIITDLHLSNPQILADGRYHKIDLPATEDIAKLLLKQ